MDRQNNPTSRLSPNKHAIILLVVLLCINAALCVSSALRKSVTIDEYALLPNGIAILKERAFHIDAGVPPLSKILFALPVLLTPAKFDTSTVSGYKTSWQCGIQFATENPEYYHNYFIVGRIISITVLLFTILLTYGLANRLYGPAGGLIAAFFTSLSPNLIAHGRLATTDIYLAAAIIGTLWAFDYFLKKPNHLRSTVLGVTIGIACLCKLTGILLFVILPLSTVIMYLVQKKKPDADCCSLLINCRTVGWGFLAFGIAMFTINLGYLFQGSFTPIGEFHFSEPFLQILQQILPSWFPIPFPYYFLLGFDIQLAEKGYDAYLLGTFNKTGFWNYYLVGFLVKTPLPILIFAILAIVSKKTISPREAPMLTVWIIMFVFFSLVGHKNIGIRYLLFIIPITCIWIGRIAISPLWDSPRKTKGLAVILTIGSMWMFVSTTTIWPDYLAYFNFISGGPAQGHRYLLDSNIDMGQDLIALRDYLKKNNIKSIDLAYFGRVPPEYYGINYRLLKKQPQQRYAVISTNLLWGRMYFVNGKSYWPSDRNEYAYLRQLTPQAVLGYSLYVYDMSKL